MPIEFDDRRFVWHPSTVVAGEHCWPVVTVIAEDGGDYAEDRLLTNRFVSALCFAIDQPMSIVSSAATGYKGEFDAPILGQPGYASTVLHAAPSTIAIALDERLRLVLALFREGRTAESPFYRFLALYNALDAAFDSDEPRRDEFIRTVLDNAPIPAGQNSREFDWAHYLRDGLRNAIAHAVRRRGKPLLNPDDLADRAALDGASAAMARLVRQRVNERWPGGVRSR